MKEERVAECLMFWERLFQTWGPKSEKVRKPWVLRLKHWSLIMRVSDEERGKIRGGGTCDYVVTQASSFCI